MRLDFYDHLTSYCYRLVPDLTLTNKETIIEFEYQQFDKSKYLLWTIDFKLNHDGMLKYYVKGKKPNIPEVYKLFSDTDATELDAFYVYNSMVSCKLVEEIMQPFHKNKAFIEYFGNKETKAGTNLIITNPTVFIHTKCSKINDCDAFIRVYFASDYYNKGSKKQPKVLQRARFYPLKNNSMRTPRLSTHCHKYKLDRKFHTIEFYQHFYNSLCQKR